MTCFDLSHEDRFLSVVLSVDWSTQLFSSASQLRVQALQGGSQWQRLSILLFCPALLPKKLPPTSEYTGGLHCYSIAWPLISVIAWRALPAGTAINLRKHLWEPNFSQSKNHKDLRSPFRDTLGWFDMALAICHKLSQKPSATVVCKLAAPDLWRENLPNPQNLNIWYHGSQGGQRKDALKMHLGCRSRRIVSMRPI